MKFYEVWFHFISARYSHGFFCADMNGACRKSPLAPGRGVELPRQLAKLPPSALVMLFLPPTVPVVPPQELSLGSHLWLGGLLLSFHPQ